MDPDIKKAKNTEEKNGTSTVRRSSRSKKTQSSWRATESDEDEAFEKELIDDPSFDSDADQEYVGEANVLSEESDEDFTIGKKRKTPILTPRKSKRSKKAKRTLPTPSSNASRRSSRTTNQKSYCEDSSEEEIFELCEGQPKVSSEKQTYQSPKKRKTSTRKTSTSARKSKAKKSQESVKQIKSEDCAVIVSPQLLKTNLSSRPSRNARQSRSQVSYAEDTSGDDSESYEICDGQPIRRDQVENLSTIAVGSTIAKHKLHELEKKSSKAVTSSQPKLNDDNHCNDDDSSCNDKVVLIKGQPILKSKAMSMLAEDNQFFMPKNLLEDISSEQFNVPLCIWKLHGKLLQKFVQVDISKQFESTLNCLGFDEETENDYVPIKAIVFAEKEEQLLAEVSDCPENKDINKAIDLRAKASNKRKTQRQKSDGKTSPPVEKVKKTISKQARPLKKRDYMESDHSSSGKKGRPRKTPTETEKEEVEGFLTTFPLYLKHLLKASVSKQHLQNLTEEDISDLSVIENLLTSLSDQLVEGLALNEDFLEDLKSRPIFLLEGDVTDRMCEAVKNAKVQADEMVSLAGRCYDRASLQEVEDEENITKQYAVCEKIVGLGQAYHKLRHLKKTILFECINKFDKMSESGSKPVESNHRDGITTLSDGKSGVEEVRQTLDGVISQVESSFVNCPFEEARKMLNDVVSSVSDKCDMNTIDKCLMDKDWVERMSANLKGAVLDAKLLIASR